MMCEKLTAFLDDELSAIGRLAMSAHLRLCGRCRLDAAEWRHLACQIGELEDESVPPALRERVHADALTAAASARTHRPSLAVERSRRQGMVTMRRMVVAVALAGLLTGAALWLFPGRRGDAAMAAVAEAMANVESVHFTGSTLDYGTGKRRPVEGWVKGRKFRMVTEGTEDVVDDGERLVTVSTTDDFIAALISPSGDYVALSEGATYLDLFRGGRAFDQLGHGMEVTRWETVVLPDGQTARKATLVSGGRGSVKVVLTISDTDLLFGIDEYVDGKLVDSIDRVEYGVEVPDSVFETDIPENAVVTDKTAPPSQASAENWKRVQAAAKRLSAKGAVITWYTPPGSQAAGGTSGGGMYHPGLLLHPLDNNGTIILYTPWNTYVVFGSVLVEDTKGRLPRRVVTNEEFAGPGPPVKTIEQEKAEEARERAEAARRCAPTPEMQARWEAKARELEALGARKIFELDGSVGFGGCMFEMATEKAFRLWYSPARGEYYVMGKARIYNDKGFDKTVEDDWIKVPGPPPKLPDE